jgi:ribosome recycling factor
MESAVEHLLNVLTGIRTGRANPSLLDSLRVEYHGAQLPINQVAVVTASDTRTLVVRAFEPGSVPFIERAILQSKLGLTPQRAGQVIHLPIPPLSGERQNQLVSQSKSLAESQRVAVRNIRRDSHKDLGQLELSEDERVSAKETIELLTKNYIAKIDQALQDKINMLLDVANRWTPKC